MASWRGARSAALDEPQANGYHTRMARRARTPITRPARPALADKATALDGADYLASRAARASRALARVPDAAPEPSDRMG